MQLLLRTRMRLNHKLMAVPLASLVAIATTCALAVNNVAQDECQKGANLAIQGKYRQSLEALDKSIKLDPDFALAYLERARVLNRLRRNKEALESVNKCITLDPENGAAYSIRSWTLSTLKRYREAVRDANIAIPLLSSSAPYDSRAKAYLGLGQLKRALADCNKAIAIDNDPSNFHTRAQVWIGLGKYRNAVNDCTRAIKMYPQGFVYYDTRARAYAKLGETKLSSKDREKSKSLKVIENQQWLMESDSTKR